jgi:DNA-directed RNA polymerase specialized sigma24 family protein
MSVGNPNRDLGTSRGDAPADAGIEDSPRDPSEGLQRDAAFVSLLRAGDPSAFGLLFDGWADPVYDRLSHQGFTTTDVCDLSTRSFASVHRRLLQQTSDDSFRVLIFRSVRQEMIAAADRRVQWRMPVGPYAEDRLERGTDGRSLAADAAVAALLWVAADVLGDRVREVLDLHERHGFTAAEIAAVLNEPTGDVEDILGKLRVGFGAVVRAQVLWREGTPTHDELAAAVVNSEPFDTDTVRLIAGHQNGCASCRETARMHVDPIDVFAAIPLATAPLGLNEVVVERLTDLDVSMIGSVAYRDPAAIAAGEPGAPPPPRPPPGDSTSAALAPPLQPSDPAPVVPPQAESGRPVGDAPARPATVDPGALAADVRARNLVTSEAGSPTDLRVAPQSASSAGSPSTGLRRRWFFLGLGSWR